MLLDHIIMTLLIMIVAMPAMIASFNNTLTNEVLLQMIPNNWTFYLMIFGLSLNFNKDVTTAIAPPKKNIEKTVTVMQGVLLYKDMKTQKKEDSNKDKQKEQNDQNSNNNKPTNKSTDQSEKKDFYIVPLTLHQ